LNINKLNLEINKGEILGLVGPNGSGKSTLLYLMHGLLKPVQGNIYLDGMAVSRMDFQELSIRQGILFQNPNHQIFGSSIYDELAFGMKNLGLAEKEIENALNWHLSSLTLEIYLKIRIHSATDSRSCSRC
jgi:energy-coupling factor transport system ATP-binding protein